MRFALWGNDNSLDLLDAEIDEIRAAGHAVLLAEMGDGKVIGFAEVSIRPFAEPCDTRNAGYLEGWWVDTECVACVRCLRLISSACVRISNPNAAWSSLPLFTRRPLFGQGDADQLLAPTAQARNSRRPRCPAEPTIPSPRTGFRP